MTTSEAILEYLLNNKERFKTEYKLVKIGLFGSYARGENQSGSDIDILVEFQDNTPDLFGKKLSLINEIESNFNLPVDICREKYIKPAFREMIFTEARYV
ncbi:MAG: nucleotidyltransferase domain-containing protein [Prolixibacteraceae bacterium]|nr:nucleotidyltransferase domain-containing protein [Prolixibacteraceae bacterium]